MGVPDSAALEAFYMVRNQQNSLELTQLKLELQELTWIKQRFVAAQPDLRNDQAAVNVLQSHILKLQEQINAVDRRIMLLESDNEINKSAQPVAQQKKTEAIQRVFGK